MDKKFCPKCGNKTLKRVRNLVADSFIDFLNTLFKVSVTLNEDGSQQIHISTRRPINTKGTKYSLPAPKGGKENEKNVFCSL